MRDCRTFFCSSVVAVAQNVCYGLRQNLARILLGKDTSVVFPIVERVRVRECESVGV